MNVVMHWFVSMTVGYCTNGCLLVQMNAIECRALTAQSCTLLYRRCCSIGGVYKPFCICTHLNAEPMFLHSDVHARSSIRKSTITALLLCTAKHIFLTYAVYYVH